MKGYKKSIDRLKRKLLAAGLLNGGCELEKEKMIAAGVDAPTISMIERRLAGESYAKIGQSIDEKGFRGRSYQAVKIRIEQAIRLSEKFIDGRKP